MAGHLLWLRHSKQKQKRWRDIGQNSVLAAKSRRILGHINEMHEIGGVCGVWRAVRVSHLLAISVIGGDDAFAIKIEELRNNPRNTFVHRFYGLNSGFQNLAKFRMIKS